jgi:hypothetical protein
MKYLNKFNEGIFSSKGVDKKLTEKIKKYLTDNYQNVRFNEDNDEIVFTFASDGVNYRGDIKVSDEYQQETGIKNIMKTKVYSAILERKKHKYSGEIGNIVKDIIKVFKDNVDGEFYLPEDVNEDKMVYEFPKLKTSFSVELKIETNENIETFRTNAAIWHDDETISIVIQYNPKNKKTILYDLIGDLNQNIAHEIRHIYQKHFGTFNLDKPEEEEPYEYYTQPEEIDAQVFGFKRLASLSKKPYESIVRQWFEKNKDIHQLSDKETEMVINKLLEYK